MRVRLQFSRRGMRRSYLPAIKRIRAIESLGEPVRIRKPQSLADIGTWTNGLLRRLQYKLPLPQR
jgi:hypothetical protein